MRIKNKIKKINQWTSINFLLNNKIEKKNQFTKRPNKIKRIMTKLIYIYIYIYITN